MNKTRGNTYEFGDFRLDPESAVLFYKDSVVDLTPKALAILKVLVENSGQVVSKEELMQQAWPDSFVEEANLSHHIHRLRKALEMSGDKKMIETLPRRGYRFTGRLHGAAGAARPQLRASSFLGARSIVSGLLILLIAGGTAWYLRSRGSGVNEVRSIAVMPILNESGNPDLDYLTDGMTESLISSLSQVPSIRVKASSSVFKYKGKDVSAAVIGAELGVQSVLNGHMRREGDAMVLRVEIVDVTTEDQIWGKQYDRGPAMIAGLQSEVAKDVLNGLRTKASGAEQVRVGKQFTANPEAYVLYLKGRYQLNRRTEESFRKAIELFDQAVAADPGYALPYAGVADAYDQMGLWISLPPDQSFPRAKAAAERALELEPDLAEAHAALAFEKFYYEWDFAGSEREFDRAIELNPSYTFGHESRAVEIYESDPRRLVEALRGLQTAKEIDPLSLSIGFNIAALHYFEGENEKALSTLNDLQTTDPNYTLGYGLQGAVYREMGRYDEYVEAWLRASSLEGGVFDPAEIAELKKIYRLKGINQFWLGAADLLEKKRLQKYVSPVFIAMYYSSAGNKEKAFQWLETAFSERSSWLIELKVDPVWKALHGDPRYDELVRRIGFDQ